MDKGLPFDRAYSLGPTQMQVNDFTLSGFAKTMISFNNVTKTWKMQYPYDSEKYATTNGTTPPFGTKEYILSEPLGGGSILLNLNACDESKEFNCKDGSCIPSEKRCNAKVDCFDASDESDCNRILIPKSYLKHVPGRKNLILLLKYSIYIFLSVKPLKSTCSLCFVVGRGGRYIPRKSTSANMNLNV